jgi:hypothetical protein
VNSATTYIGLPAPPSKRVMMLFGLMSDHDNFCAYDPQVCALSCAGTSRSQMAGRTEAYPQIFPCREGWADAIVQSATISCSKRPAHTRSDSHAACILELEMLFADYLFGNVTVRVTSASGATSYGLVEIRRQAGIFLAGPCSHGGAAGKTSMIRTVKHVDAPSDSLGAGATISLEAALVDDVAAATANATVLVGTFLAGVPSTCPITFHVPEVGASN